MHIQMNSGEANLLNMMNGGNGVTPACERAYHLVRGALLNVGFSIPLDKCHLAIIHAVSQLINTDPQPIETQAREVERPRNGEGRPMITPDENISRSDMDLVASRYSNANGNHEYTGPRAKWNNGGFKSKPGDDVKKWERNRPLTYISERDGVRYPGVFVRVNKQDKTRANITSCEMKKAFSVPIKAIELSDLSPPSPIPLAQQI